MSCSVLYLSLNKVTNMPPSNAVIVGSDNPASLQLLTIFSAPRPYKSMYPALKQMSEITGFLGRETWWRFNLSNSTPSQ
ncbi:hypothetical protein FNW25_00880 [Flavobacterium franklandianum]|uniref:hypothetical protein n=1 Tax=Flavobacterium franklandianum TaxID=2594430 RepID=UPI00117B6A26|nr:hypothetical protein [Flavobacterium franklandianum]TRX30083.1 hypothetical protein FNW25_00880 [Flavobacterium franklandianum]